MCRLRGRRKAYFDLNYRASRQIEAHVFQGLAWNDSLRTVPTEARIQLSISITYFFQMVNRNLSKRLASRLLGYQRDFQEKGYLATKKGPFQGWLSFCDKFVRMVVDEDILISCATRLLRPA